MKNVKERKNKEGNVQISKNRRKRKEEPNKEGKNREQ